MAFAHHPATCSLAMPTTSLAADLSGAVDAVLAGQRYVPPPAVH